MHAIDTQVFAVPQLIYCCPLFYFWKLYKSGCENTGDPIRGWLGWDSKNS